MKTQNIAAILMEDCKTISVMFQSNNEKYYTYKTMEDFQIGDKAVVRANGTLKIAKCVEVHKVPRLDSDSCYQWIIQKIDETKVNELIALETEFQDHLLELEQKAVRANAQTMLIEKLGVNSTLIKSAIKKLNGV